MFGFSVDSVLASAIELIRKPANAAFTIGIVVASLVVVRLVLLIINALARRVRFWAKIKSSDDSPLSTRLAVEAIYALALIYAAFLAGNLAGWQTFKDHRYDTRANNLLAVTVVTNSDGTIISQSVLCGRTKSEAAKKFIGSAKSLHQFEKQKLGCSGSAQSWRLLLADDNHVYIFSAVPADGSRAVSRPVTLAIPRSDDLIFILQ